MFALAVTALGFRDAIFVLVLPTAVCAPGVHETIARAVAKGEAILALGDRSVGASIGLPLDDDLVKRLDLLQLLQGGGTLREVDEEQVVPIVLLLLVSPRHLEDLEWLEFFLFQCSGHRFHTEISQASDDDLERPRTREVVRVAVVFPCFEQPAHFVVFLHRGAHDLDSLAGELVGSLGIVGQSSQTSEVFVRDEVKKKKKSSHVKYLLF